MPEMIFIGANQDITMFLDRFLDSFLFEKIVH